MNNKTPHPWIQNHVNWCWATAAKITGLHFCKVKGLDSDNIWKDQYPWGIIRDDLTGLVPQYTGCMAGAVTADAWQYKIVEHAGGRENTDGNAPEYDDAKVRALHYVAAEVCRGARVQVNEYGYYKDRVPLGRQACFKEIEAALSSNLALIGNYISQTGLAHSVVVLPSEGQTLRVYDPQDGTQAAYTLSQLFETGFPIKDGLAVIQWVQYIASF